MLINHLLFWMMMTEAVVCLVISLPFGKSVSLKIIQFMHARLGGKDSIAASVGTVVLAIVGLLFLSDVYSCYKYHSDDAIWSDGMRIRLLTAQRDMYISGFCLFLFLLLRLVYHSLETNMRLEKSLAAMKKQAEGASAGYKKLLEESESASAQLKKLKELLGGDLDEESVKKSGGAAKPLAKLLEENAELAKKLEATTKELKSAEAKVDAVKKQAEGQSAAFMKLMDDKSKADKQVADGKTLESKLKAQAEEIAALKSERDSLKSQVQDYDFMFADAKKKAD